MTPINDLDKFLAQKLHSYRKKMNWPLKKLAGELDISLQQVQRYEQGVNKISASLLYNLASIFKTDILSFFEGFNDEDHEGGKEEKSFHILLVEDNPHDEFLFRKTLASFPKKHTLFALKDGGDALKFFHESTLSFVPDIIFLDLHLPHVMGFELLQDMKRRPLLKNIPVIIMTTSSREEDVSKSYQLQGSGFIRKSFHFDDFKESVLQALNYWSATVKLPKKALKTDEFSEHTEG